VRFRTLSSLLVVWIGILPTGKRSAFVGAAHVLPRQWEQARETAIF